MSDRHGILEKHQAVMDVAERDGNHVVWTQTLEDDEVGASLSYTQSVEMWDEMGQPDVLTITVEPHDRLNAPRSLSSQLTVVEAPRG